MKTWILICFAITAIAACGGKNGGSGGDPDANGTGDGGGGSGDGGTIDAPPFPGTCSSTGPQCANCIDDDRDGRIDGNDPQCTGATDNDEATFATGIPGDNKDAINQDCFFDGNSGAGNDGCNIHVCCLLGAKNLAECRTLLGQNNVNYDPNQCPPPIGTTPLSQQCIDTCGKLAPPGCDCFGCCTICDPASPTNACYDILVNPVTSPNCGPTTLGDRTKCLTCTKTTTCGNPVCGDMSCILCPGQDPSDLPPGCNMMNVCPNGEPTCVDDNSCGAQQYCSSGCCIGVIL